MRRSCGCAGRLRRTRSRWCPACRSTVPRMPVSSATSRTAVCCSVSPASRWPLGSDHSSRPRRSMRPISAALAPAPRWSSTSPPALVSSTRRSGRRGGGVGFEGIASMYGRPGPVSGAGSQARRTPPTLGFRVRLDRLPARGCRNRCARAHPRVARSRRARRAVRCGRTRPAPRRRVGPRRAARAASETTST